MLVEIRPWDLEDAMTFHRLSMHPYYLHKRVWKYLYPDTFLRAVATIRFYQQADSSRFLYRAILYDHVVCGFLQCEVSEQGTCELSYWLGVPYWNRGIMSQAVAKMCKDTFAEWQVLSIYARVEETNRASIAVLRHNGFILDKTKECILFRKYK